MKTNIDELNLSTTLKNLGINPVLSGYDYIKDAVRIVMSDFEACHLITKRVYATLGKRYNKRSSAIERGIRNAIEVGWLRGNPDLQKTLFGYSIDSNRGKPTNGEFIATVADYLCMIAESAE